MQQTRLDLWLRKKFAYSTTVSTYRLPNGYQEQPDILVQELEQKSAKDYRFCLTFQNERSAESFIKELKKQNMLYNSNVREKDSTFAKFLCKRGRSVTFYLIWKVIFAILFSAIAYAVFLLLKRPQTIELFQNAWNEFLKNT